MLRINLLPPYVFDDQKKRNVMILWGSLTVVAAVAGVLWIQTSKAAADKSEEDNKVALDFQTQYTTTDNKIKTVKDAVAVTKSKQEFVLNATTYNSAWSKVYEDIRNLTSSKVVLDKLILSSPTTVDVTGFAPTELDVARWWTELRKSELFEKVNFELPPHPYPPTGGAGGAASPMTASFPSGAGNPMAGGGMGGAMSGMMGRGGPSGMAGGGAGAAGGGKAGEGLLEGRPGLVFTAKFVLRKAFAEGKSAPSWPAGGGAPAGGGGGMSGMMGGGGMSGMMSGGPSGGASGSGGGGGATTAPASGGKLNLGGRKGTED
ncbi:MAG: hypothetical protein NT023_21350 [Armatimonadetes bacterium]|nr:hypothetical protein [Armatimonadota bacterium]